MASACRMALHAVHSCDAATHRHRTGHREALGAGGRRRHDQLRKAKNVEDTVAALRAEGLDVMVVACHVGSLEQVQRLIKVHAALASATRIGQLLHGLLTVPS